MEKGKTTHWDIRAFWTATSGGFTIGAAATSQSANITAKLWSYGATNGTSTTTANPTELEGGVYRYPITSSETDVTGTTLIASCSTSGVSVRALPESRIPRPTNFQLIVSSTAGNVNTDVKLIEASDPTDTILSSVVDDATRIDASALNTLSGHDPGATIGTSTLTTAGAQTACAAALNAHIDTAGAGLTAVPWNATWDAEVQSECYDALNQAMPASPTGDSTFDYITRTKYEIVNKKEITEASGNSTTYKDDDTTAISTVAAAYTSDSTTTTRKRLE